MRFTYEIIAIFKETSHHHHKTYYNPTIDVAADIVNILLYRHRRLLNNTIALSVALTNTQSL